MRIAQCFSFAILHVLIISFAQGFCFASRGTLYGNHCWRRQISLLHSDFTTNNDVKCHNTFESEALTLKGKLEGINVYLVGLMGCGKTTIGRELAERLCYQHVDTDTAIETRIGMPISAYFDKFGEDQFRVVESSVLQELASKSALVVSTGGGIVIKDENWEILGRGIVIFLDVPIETIITRLEKDKEAIASRPLLRDTLHLSQRLHTLRTERSHKYLKADVHVIFPPSISAVQESTEFVAKRILEVLESNPHLRQSKLTM